MCWHPPIRPRVTTRLRAMMAANMMGRARVRVRGMVKVGAGIVVLGGAAHCRRWPQSRRTSASQTSPPLDPPPMDVVAVTVIMRSHAGKVIRH